MLWPAKTKRNGEDTLGCFMEEAGFARAGRLHTGNNARIQDLHTLDFQFTYSEADVGHRNLVEVFEKGV